MIYAEMNTGSWTFRAIDTTEGKAKKAIVKAWKVHQEQLQFRAEHQTLRELEEYYGINSYLIEPGAALRDSDRLV